MNMNDAVSEYLAFRREHESMAETTARIANETSLRRDLEEKGLVL